MNKHLSKMYKQNNSVNVLPTIMQEFGSCNFGIIIVGLYFLLEFGSIQYLYNNNVKAIGLPSIVAGFSICYALFLLFTRRFAFTKLSFLFFILCLYIISASYFMTIHSIIIENNLKLFLVYFSNYIILAHSIKTITGLLFILDIWLVSVAYTCLHSILQGGLLWSSAWVSDENQFAVLCVTAIPLSYVLMELYQSKSKKLCYLICLLLYFSGVIVATSRGGFVACLFVLFCLWRFTSKKLRFFIALICLLLMVLNFAPSKFFNEFDNISDDAQANTAGERFYLWRLGINMFRDHPLFGVGPFNYSEFLYPYDQMAEMRESSSGTNFRGRKRVAHSTPVTILAEFGVIGSSLFVLFQFTMVKYWFAMRKRVKESAQSCLHCNILLFVTTAVLIAQFGFWIGSIFLTLVGFPFWYVLLPFFEVSSSLFNRYTN